MEDSNLGAVEKSSMTSFIWHFIKFVNASLDTGGGKSTIPCDSISSRVSHQDTLTSSGDTTYCMTQTEGQRWFAVLLANKKSPEVTMQLSVGIFMKAIEINENAGYRDS